VSAVKINAITVPRKRFEEFEHRFASRAGRVSAAPGFEGFELLRPTDDREVCLVLTRERSTGTQRPAGQPLAGPSDLSSKADER
jgi:heme oxygenase (mycobilin-producing)